MGLLDWLCEVGEKHGFTSSDSASDTAESGSTSTSQPGAPDYTLARIVHGGGGYVYAQWSDDELVIMEGPGGQKDQPVKRNTKAWKAITDEIGTYKGGPGGPGGHGGSSATVPTSSGETDDGAVAPASDDPHDVWNHRVGEYSLLAMQVGQLMGWADSEYGTEIKVLQIELSSISDAVDNDWWEQALDHLDRSLEMIKPINKAYEAHLAQQEEEQRNEEQFGEIYDKQREFDEKNEQAWEDGVVTDAEEAELDRLQKEISDTFNEKMGGDDAEEIVMDDLVEDGKITGTKMTFASYEDDFVATIKSWANSAAIAVLEVKSMIDGASSSEEENIATKVLGELESSFSGTAAGAYADAAKRVYAWVETAYKMYEKTYVKSQKTASVNDVADAMIKGFQNISSSTPKDNGFEALVKGYKKENKIPEDVVETWDEVFGMVVETFPQKNLPSPKKIKKTFVKRIIKGSPDTFDRDPELPNHGTDEEGNEVWIGGMDELSGYAYVTMLQPGSIDRDFTSPTATLNDVSKKVLEGVRKAYAGQGIIDLPVQIMVDIRNTAPTASLEDIGIDLAPDVEKTEVVHRFWRESDKPGSTSFVFVKGDKRSYDAFMKLKAYKKPRVAHLK